VVLVERSMSISTRGSSRGSRGVWGETRGGKFSNVGSRDVSISARDPAELLLLEISIFSSWIDLG
jgi:hypothetical protein